jgi:cobalamin-dependent methionine synthase I
VASSKWLGSLAGLRGIQGKGSGNSISINEGVH